MQGLTTFWTLFIMRHSSILPTVLSSVLYQCSKALMLALWFLSSSNHPLCLDKTTVECSSTAIVKQKLVVVVSTKERPIPSDECDEGNYNLGPHFRLKGKWHWMISSLWPTWTALTIPMLTWFHDRMQLLYVLPFWESRHEVKCSWVVITHLCLGQYGAFE
jgi:hypothetical protein